MESFMVLGHISPRCRSQRHPVVVAAPPRDRDVRDLPLPLPKLRPRPEARLHRRCIRRLQRPQRAPGREDRQQAGSPAPGSRLFP